MPRKARRRERRRTRISNYWLGVGWGLCLALPIVLLSAFYMGTWEGADGVIKATAFGLGAVVMMRELKDAFVNSRWGNGAPTE